MHGELILAAEAAHRLGVTTTMLNRWEQAGILRPAFRLGSWRLRVYRAQDVESLALARETTKAAGNGQRPARVLGEVAAP